jgi:hypothetical protein
MAGDWIKMRLDLDTDPTVIGVAHELGTPELWVVGAFWKLWAWADGQTRDGNAPGVTGAWLDRFVQMPGFAAAAVRYGWLTIEKCGLSIPEFTRHCSKSAKARALGAVRTEKSRNGATVTPASPEKRREENRKPPIPPAGGVSVKAAAPKKARTPRPRWSGPLPAVLDVAPFPAVWAAHLTHRDEIRKPVTPTAGKLALEQLVPLGPAEAARWVAHSTAHGWQGIFEPERGPSRKAPAPPPAGPSKPDPYADMDTPERRAAYEASLNGKRTPRMTLGSNGSTR